MGYSRAVRAGNVVEVSGTVAMDGETVIAPNDAYGQTIAVLEIIEVALKEAGASLSDVVRTRMFVTDITRWEDIGKAHGEFFSATKPATTMVGVKALIHPELIVEIEATAIIEE